MASVSYHVHSTWSDGRAGIAEMVAAAEVAGLAEIGVSDHFILTPYDDTNAGEWSMPRNGRGLAAALAELRAVAATAALPVRIGVEADYFPETWSTVAGVLGGLDLDYVIASVHYVERFSVDSAARFWAALSPDAVDAVYRGYWERVRQMAECRLGDIVAHLDLPKKFGYRPRADLSREIEAALDAIARAGMAIELNTSGWDKPCREPYPDAALLAQVRARGIPMVLSADAHGADEVTRHFARGTALLRQVGVGEVLAFERRRAHPIPLPS